MQQHSQKKRLAWVLTLGSLVLLGLFVGLRLHAARQVASMVEQQAAQRWQGDSSVSMVQATAFFPQADALGSQDLAGMAQSVETALTAAGINSSQVHWVWAASGQSSGAVSYGENTASVEITAVQGDFFVFHPMPLLSGSYLSAEDVMHDRVIIDQLTAWQLYGSSDDAGMELDYNGQRYYVAGVVQAFSGEANRSCYGDNTARIYLFSDSGAAEIPLTTVELVVPEPVAGFALATLQSALPAANGEYLANTGRFSFANSLGLLSSLSLRGVQSSEIRYPYWENAARLTENNLAILALLSLVVLIWPLCSLCFGLCCWRRKWQLGQKHKPHDINMEG